MRNAENEIFGRWRVISFAEKDKNHATKWNCICECGTKRIVRLPSLINGASKSCGCFHSENMVKKMTKHGRSRDSIYKTWSQMIQRCTNKKNRQYPRYGGRGINIEDPRWFKFENFLKDMGERRKGLQIDRTDNNFGYCKENCRWVKPATNIRNRSNTKLYKFKGKNLTIPEWSRKLGIHRNTLARRIELGWPMKKVFGEAVKKQYSKRYRNK